MWQILGHGTGKIGGKDRKGVRGELVMTVLVYMLLWT